MHRLRSISTIYRFRFAAFLLFAKFLLAPVAVGVVVYSFLVDDHELTLIGMALASLTVVVVIAQWLVANRTNCPLCMTPVLADKGCTKHRHAKAFLGNHQLRVALAILFRNSFRCPYCHEPTALRVRERKHR